VGRIVETYRVIERTKNPPVLIPIAYSKSLSSPHYQTKPNSFILLENNTHFSSIFFCIIHYTVDVHCAVPHITVGITERKWKNRALCYYYSSKEREWEWGEWEDDGGEEKSQVVRNKALHKLNSLSFSHSLSRSLSWV